MTPAPVGGMGMMGDALYHFWRAAQDPQAREPSAPRAGGERGPWAEGRQGLGNRAARAAVSDAAEGLSRTGRWPLTLTKTGH